MLLTQNEQRTENFNIVEVAAQTLAGENALNDLYGSSFTRHQAFDFALKRCLDVTMSLTALLILAPALVTICGLIRIEGPGSPLFTQVRWGRGGTKIKIYKFRSMRTDVGDPTGVRQTVRNDPRVTKIGAVLRRTNLDELPQLFNVLRGDMSLVGPRCHAIGMLAAGIPYEQLVPQYHHRHAVRPGLTGLAQMKGLRGPTDRASKARARIYADLLYIEKFSFFLDLRILVGTLWSEMTDRKGF